MNATNAEPKNGLFRRRKNRDDNDLESYRDIADDVVESDFVPYACLIDEMTIVTKNGELTQTIKIDGLHFEGGDKNDLRSAIRNAIQQAIPDESYAIWLHTLRRRKQLVSPGHFPDAFTADLDARWGETHPASASFVNELYLTIVKAGQPAELKRIDQLVHSLAPKRETSTRNAYLDQSAPQIKSVTQRLLAVLKPYGARALGIVERNGIFYSEQLEFLEKLINLEDRQIVVPMADLSRVLTSGDITFGHNAMEVRTAEGKRRFATIMTLKEYKESTLGGIDKFLDIPCELIVSQCFDFIGADRARATYETQAHYLDISGDKELAGWLEIDRLMQAGQQKRAFGEQQTTVFLIAPSIRQLEQNVRLTQKALSRLGMVAIREDLRFEECYWAQLPGNFTFITRKQPIDTQHVAGFATVQTQPMGNAAGSAWGPPVSLFTTVHDAPYFFNFQRENSGHTIVLGKAGTGRTSVAHFLLAQARRLPLSIWYLDTHGRGTAFMSAMGGKAFRIGTPQCQLNPFALPDNPANREFLAIWLSTLIDAEGKQLNQSTLGFFQSLVGAVMQLPPHERRLSALLPIVQAQDAMLATHLQRWCAGGAHGELFDMPIDTFQPGPLSLWDISHYAGSVQTRAPLAGYLLHRLTIALTEQPTLIVLDEGFDLLANPLFGQRSAPWLDYIAAKNASAILMSDKPEQSGNYPFTPALAQRAASIFAMPDDEPGGEYAYGFGFSESEMGALAHMSVAARHVLLKREAQSSMLKMDLSNLGQHLATLNGRQVLQPEKSASDLLSELMGYKTAGAVA